MGGEQNIPSYLKNNPLVLHNKFDDFILPSRMNKLDCSRNINVVEDGFIVHYSGKY